MLTRVMSFNLRQNVATDGEHAWPYRLKAVKATIAFHDPDIIGIQEGLYDMLLDLETLLPEYTWFGEGREGGKNGEFNAIIYKRNKWSVVEGGNFSLSETPEQLGVMNWDSSHPRMCTWAILKSNDGEQLLLFNTHLDHISEEAQLKGINLIQEMINSYTLKYSLPAILTGDFNVNPDHPVVKKLEHAGYLNAYSVKEGGMSIGSTVHHFKGGDQGSTIDYIFVSPDLAVNSVIIDRRQFEGKYSSDHYPVLALVTRAR